MYLILLLMTDKLGTTMVLTLPVMKLGPGKFFSNSLQKAELELRLRTLNNTYTF